MAKIIPTETPDETSRVLWQCCGRTITIKNRIDRILAGETLTRDEKAQLSAARIHVTAAGTAICEMANRFDAKRTASKTESTNEKINNEQGG